ncbi:MAG: hypothetical protein MIO93_03630 [ANME-2 cluster archaeon]|jgi:SNF family Na+-dependent transporter|nr:hypothetical protein [ANME-2 cluster archaeon]
MYYFLNLFFEGISIAALLSVVYVLYKLSQRLGEALQMKPYHHLFTIGGALIFVSLVTDLVMLFNLMNFSEYQLSKYLFIENIILSLGVTLCLLPALKYWGWLIKEISH